MYALVMDYWEQVRARRTATFETITEQQPALRDVQQKVDPPHEFGASIITVGAAIASCFMGAFFMWVFIPVAVIHVAADIMGELDGKTTARKSREGPDSDREAHAV